MATTDPVHLDGNAAEELASILRGELVRSGDVNYEQHRKVWNGSIDRFPTLIARCAGAADVIAAVRFARAHGLLVAVRGGGHSFPGLVPVSRVKDSENALGLVDRLLAADLDVIEVTTTIDGWDVVIRTIRERDPEVCVGAGTVTTL